MKTPYQVYLSTPTIFSEIYEFRTLKQALAFTKTFVGEAHFSILYPDGKWHDWHRLDHMSVAAVKKEFLRLQAASNRAKRKLYREGDNHGCIEFVCECELKNDTFWPKCVKCSRALQMFNTDSRPGSFWKCPKGHPQGPASEAHHGGWRIARKPFTAPEIPGHRHVFKNNGGCALHKKLDANRAETSYWFQKFWSDIPRKVLEPGGHVPSSWIKTWYAGTEFAC
jgi:hypothetical protein